MRRALAFLPLLFIVLHSATAADLVITERMHHLRSGAEREWAEFSGQAEGTELVLPFQAKPNETEQTLPFRSSS